MESHGVLELLAGGHRGPARALFPATPAIRSRLGWLAAQVRSWPYAGSRRDLRIDMLRGYAALAMIADHVGGRSWLAPLTGGNLFLVSAAEAFVFISGLVMGMVYCKIIVRDGFAAALNKVLLRAAKLYVLTVVLTLSFALTGLVLGLQWRPDLSQGGVGAFVLQVATLRRTLVLTDIPLLYTLLLVASVPVLFLLSLRRWQAVVVVLACSWLIWAAWQVSPGTIGLPWRISGNTLFNLPAWQVIFVSAIVLGYRWRDLERLVARLSRRTLTGSLALVSTAVVCLYVLQLTRLNALRADRLIYSLGYDKANVPIGRLVVLALLACFAFSGLTLLWGPVSRLASWLLLPLGQNPLTAYSLHIFLIAMITKITAAAFGGQLTSATATALQAGAVLVVWLIVRSEVIRRTARLIPRGLRASWLPAGCRRPRPGPLAPLPRRIGAGAI